MSSNEFFDFIKQKYDEDFANYVCNELTIFTPTALLVIDNKVLEKYVAQVYPNLTPQSLKYYTGDHNNKLVGKRKRQVQKVSLMDFVDMYIRKLFPFNTCICPKNLNLKIYLFF
jgi:hypothetical protein